MCHCPWCTQAWLAAKGKSQRRKDRCPREIETAQTRPDHISSQDKPQPTRFKCAMGRSIEPDKAIRRRLT